MMYSERMGARIRACRIEKGMTQRQLADALGVCDRTVSKWERCRGCPDISLLADLSRVLGADLEELLAGSARKTGGIMRKLRFFVCPVCGSDALRFRGGHGMIMTGLDVAAEDEADMPTAANEDKHD